MDAAYGKEFQSLLDRSEEYERPPARTRAGLAAVRLVGPAHADQLAKAGVTSIEDLLREVASPATSRRLAQRLGVSSLLVERWADVARLMEIEGIGSDYANLLTEGGIWSPHDLARKESADQLRELLREVNEIRSVVHRIPSRAILERWIQKARVLLRGSEQGR
jgi:predicted flap endonuclease-1-like 5' DNA nuclease